MGRPRFSKDHRTFGEWFKAQPEGSKYAQEIARKHQYFPDKSLSQLEKIKISDHVLNTRTWESLSPKEKKDRLLSLQILREVRKGEKLSPILEKMGLRTEFALKHLGKSLYKTKGTWKVVKTDNIQTGMLIYSTEGQRTIITASSKDRSIIGEYFASVQKAVRNNDLSILVKFKDVQIKDANGKIHYFETDLQALHEIMEAQEEPEFLEIYQH